MIASRIKELREALKLSMPEFGKRLGCSRDVIANIEYERVEPKEVFLNHICEIYGVNHQWLFFGKGALFANGVHDEKVREAAEIFRQLSPDLRELALSQLKSLQKLMLKNVAQKENDTQDNLDTIRLMAALLEAQELEEIKGTANKPASVSKNILEIMNSQNISISQLAYSSDLDEKELELMLNSDNPIRRDTLIAVSIGLSLDAEEAQRLLTAAGLPALYAKNRRDAACLFVLMKGLGVTELNKLLVELEEPTL